MQLETINFKSILTSRFHFSAFFKTIIFEGIYCLAIYFGYAIFSMLTFGEGAHSFMYSRTNEIIYLGLIILPPTIFNLYRFFKRYNAEQPSKAKTYFIVQILLTIIFIWFVVVIAPVVF